MSLSNRPNTPVKSSLFVKLITEKELRKDTVKRFYSTIKNNSPSGVLGSYSTTDPFGNPAEVYLVHRITEDKKHEYEIPLVRNLTPDEVEHVALNLDRVLHEGNFLFETTTFNDKCCLYEDGAGIVLEPEISQQFAEKLSERLHTKWLHERMDNGWRYAQNRSDVQKTHPLVRPWNQLTEDQKSVDYSLPNFFIDLLEEFGYTVVSNDELDKLIKKAK